MSIAFTVNRNIDASPRFKPLLWLSIYKPLVLSLLIVGGLTYLLSLVRSVNGMISVHQLMNIFMGVFFIVFALPKFFDLSGFATSFSRYDLISRRYILYAKTYPFIELGIGLLLLSDYSINSMLISQLVNIVIAFISTVGLVGVARSLRNKEELECACMGSTFKFPLSKVAILENGLMLFMALGMLFFFQDSMQMSALSLTHFGIIK